MNGSTATGVCWAQGYFVSGVGARSRGFLDDGGQGELSVHSGLYVTCIFILNQHCYWVECDPPMSMSNMQCQVRSLAVTSDRLFLCVGDIPLLHCKLF